MACGEDHLQEEAGAEFLREKGVRTELYCPDPLGHPWQKGGRRTYWYIYSPSLGSVAIVQTS